MARIAMKDKRFYSTEWIGSEYSKPRLSKKARRKAVSLVATGSVDFIRCVKRQPGNTWFGHPVYTFWSGTVLNDYVVGRSKTVPENAVKIDGTPLWVLKI